MARPALTLRLVLLAALLGSAARAQTAAPAPTAPATAGPPAFPKLVKLFAGAPPKYDPPRPDALASAPDTAGDQPRNAIIRLPTYVVRGTARPPDEYEILTPKGRDAAMAQRYLGPQSGLDRALNGVTLTGLWKSIPLLGRIPFVPFSSMTYDQRAALIYEQPEKKRRLEELLSIGPTTPDTANTKAAAPPSK
jgi:hypothetical protein